MAVTSPPPTDLSHHINSRSNARNPSPLKDILQYMAYDGMISLSGGLPHPSLFPIREMSVTTYKPSGDANDFETLTLSDQPGINPPLSKFLQYGNCKGNDELRNWCLEFTEKVYQPASEKVEVLLHPGNTNAWSKVVNLLCEPGEHILCEAFTYPSAQALWIPEGYLAAPISMDDQGIKDDALEATLASWEETHPEKRRPHVIYMVSVGSNPSGVTMGAERRQKIYDLAVKYDLIIVEDDPYYFLQYPMYEIGIQSKAEDISNEKYLASLAPSFLRYDFQGRVIRLDSFSKSLAPGLRLGFFVSNPIFIERLLRATEVETQEPSGLSQAIILSLFQKWTMDGYISWLKTLRLKYQTRRDWMIDAFAQYFDLVPSTASSAAVVNANGILASMPRSDGSGSVPIFSFVPRLGADKSIVDPEHAFAQELWMKWIDELVLLVPGSYYHPWQGKDMTSTKARKALAETSHFRFSFAMPSEEQVKEGIARFARVIKQSWKI